MYEALRTVKAVEQAFKDGRYVYFRANVGGVLGGWIRVGHRGRIFIRGLLRNGEVRTRA